MGSKLINNVKYRESYAFFGTIGGYGHVIEKQGLDLKQTAMI